MCKNLLMFYSAWTVYYKFPRYKPMHVKIFINSFKSISDFFLSRNYTKPLKILMGNKILHSKIPSSDAYFD